MAKQPRIQTTLRAEIRDFLRASRERGEDTIPVTEYDKMTYTQAVLKVASFVLRLYMGMNTYAQVGDIEVL